MAVKRRQTTTTPLAPLAPLAPARLQTTGANDGDAGVGLSGRYLSGRGRCHRVVGAPLPLAIVAPNASRTLRTTGHTQRLVP